MRKTGLLLSTLMMMFPAHAAEIIDDPAKTRIVRDTLDTTCVSYKAKDVEACIRQTVQLTNTLASEFKNHIAGAHPDAAATIDEACTQGIAKINESGAAGRYAGNLELFVSEGAIASLYCLETKQQTETSLGLSFLPDVTDILSRHLNNIKNGKLEFSIDI